MAGGRVCLRCEMEESSCQYQPYKKVKVKVAQSCLTLWDPVDCRRLAPLSLEFSWPRDWIWVSCIAGRFFTVWATREAHPPYGKRSIYVTALTPHMICTGATGGSVARNLLAVQPTQVQSLGQEDPLEEAWQPLQYSCLESPMDREAWWATVHRVRKSWTGLSNYTTAATPVSKCSEQFQLRTGKAWFWRCCYLIPKTLSSSCLLPPSPCAQAEGRKQAGWAEWVGVRREREPTLCLFPVNTEEV